MKKTIKNTEYVSTVYAKASRINRQIPNWIFAKTKSRKNKRSRNWRHTSIKL